MDDLIMAVLLILLLICLFCIPIMIVGLIAGLEKIYGPAIVTGFWCSLSGFFLAVIAVFVGVLPL